jgi:CRP-like cAMP-binding protein
MLPLKNQCFALLPEYIRTALRPHLTLTEVHKGITLASLVREPTLYFPITCVLAITATATDEKGAFLRFASTGVAIGLQPAMSNEPVRSEAVVCGAGYLFFIPSSVVWDLLASPSVLEASYMNLVRAIASRALIQSFCASSHSISQRLATMLLSAEDEFGRGSEISLSQSEIAHWMFVRRESIANFLADWSGRGVIATGRSKIVINDRDWLQVHGCTCYGNPPTGVGD